jgi:hypothetical protein
VHTLLSSSVVAVYVLHLVARRQSNHELLLGGGTLCFALGQTLLSTLLLRKLGFGAFVHALADACFIGGILFRALESRIRVLGPRSIRSAKHHTGGALGQETSPRHALHIPGPRVGGPHTRQ